MDGNRISTSRRPCQTYNYILLYGNKKKIILPIYKYILLVRVICEKYRLRGETFDCSRNRYFSQITLTNRILLFNSAKYLAASKTVACKQVQNFRPPHSFDFQDCYQSTKT